MNDMHQPHDFQISADFRISDQRLNRRTSERRTSDRRASDRRGPDRRAADRRGVDRWASDPRARDRRMLNNLLLAHRLAARSASDQFHRQQRLGQAMVGLVEAADSFEEARVDLRFGAYAEPHIVRALERRPSADEVAAAQARIAAAISSQERVQELADFLGVPTAALVGGLMDATARERPSSRLRLVHEAA